MLKLSMFIKACLTSYLSPLSSWSLSFFPSLLEALLRGRISALFSSFSDVSPPSLLFPLLGVPWVSHHLVTSFYPSPLYTEPSLGLTGLWLCSVPNQTAPNAENSMFILFYFFTHLHNSQTSHARRWAFCLALFCCI